MHLALCLLLGLHLSCWQKYFSKWKYFSERWKSFLKPFNITLSVVYFGCQECESVPFQMQSKPISLKLPVEMVNFVLVYPRSGCLFLWLCCGSCWRSRGAEWQLKPPQDPLLEVVLWCHCATLITFFKDRSWKFLNFTVHASVASCRSERSILHYRL